MLGLSGCFFNNVPSPRATSNSICKITKKNNITFTTIYLKKLNRTVRIPCSLLKYLDEFEELADNLPLEDIIKFLENKYSIILQSKPQQQIKRYIYPTADKKLELPIIQFNTSFRLTSSISITPTASSDYVFGKSFILEACNDDTKTFSDTITTMKEKASFWYSTLKIPSYCIIQPTNESRSKIITGYIFSPNVSGLEDKIIFTSMIFKPLYVYYNEYPENTNITILYKTRSISKLTYYLNSGSLIENFRNNMIV